MRKRLYLIILYIGCCVLTTSAQTTEEKYRRIYDDAEQAYKIGRIEQAESELVTHLNNFPLSLRQSAYRMLALCYIDMDRPKDAERYVQMLLDDNPYYSVTLSDPQRFIDMVEDVKSGRTATITTASSQAEVLAEVPVPTTLITEEMIRNSGARNLQEVLATFVPGMTVVDCNDDINIAMRGIYSNGQEKILIMLNGHRLNSYCTNIAAPDFSIGLEKLKQIEVLRGPASSLYGGVALTAVVNLITKQGADIDGIQARAGAGNYGQFRGDLLMGKRYFDLDLLMWGNIYTSKGEVTETSTQKSIYNAEHTECRIGQIGHKPSYEFGINMKWRDLQFLYSTQFSQIIAPYTISTMGIPYDGEKFMTFNGRHPSYATQAHHADINYSHKFKNLYLKGTLTYDNNDLTHYQVISEIPLQGFSGIPYFPEEISKLIEDHSGTARYINGQEQTFGIQLKGDYNYVNSENHKGTLSFGAEYSHFSLDDMRYAVVYEYEKLAPEMSQLKEFGKGHENSHNAFLQLKHQWKSLILNAGLRYDHRTRYDKTEYNVFSPRVALILLQNKWNLKLSYSKSFVDAPYLYRKTNKMMTLWEPDADLSELNAETLHSLQLTFAGTDWMKGLNFEVNGFFNYADDIIGTQVVEHLNMGVNKTIGLELMADYHRRNFTANFNLTWLNTYKSRFSLRDINTNNSVPHVVSNLVLGWRPIPKLKLSTRTVFESRQKAYSVYMPVMLQLLNMEDQGIQPEDLPLIEELMNKLVFEQTVKARVIFNIGAEYQLTPHVQVGLNIRNLFNTQYSQSGMNTVLVPQRGRWYMASIGIKI